MFATHIDDILGRGEPDVLSKIRKFPEQRFGEIIYQESAFAHVRKELPQGSDSSVTLTQDEFSKNLQPRPTSRHLWAARSEKL